MPVLVRVAPGKTKTRLVPRLLNWLVMLCWTPLPMAVSRMTAQTPMIMPSMVSDERSLFARREETATRTASRESMKAIAPGMWHVVCGTLRKHRTLVQTVEEVARMPRGDRLSPSGVTLLQEKHLAILSTIMRDGSPQATPVWVDVEP